MASGAASWASARDAGCESVGRGDGKGSGSGILDKCVGCGGVWGWWVLAGFGCKGRGEGAASWTRALWNVGVVKETAARRFTLRCINMLLHPHSVHTSAPLQV